MQAQIQVKDVSQRYMQKGVEFQALSHVDLEIAKGEFICLLGPSGCGKTTLLNTMAGFVPVAEGSITIDGKPVKKPSIQYVTIFQNYGLLPWRTVQQNVQLGLESKRLSKAEIRDTVSHYLELVGLESFKNHHPHQLSGGMQQRVAIARALAVDPEILFMDEPFGALDALTRIKLQDEVARIQSTQKKTVIFVTHDIEESVYLADRIVVMTPNPGKIKTIIPVELGRPRDRTSVDFFRLRDHVFREFGMGEEDSTEYFI